MTEQQRQHVEASLDDAFLAFAQTLLARMEVWAPPEGVPLSLHRRVYFAEHTTAQRLEVVKDYRSLIDYHLQDPVWTGEEANLYARRFFAEVIQPSRLSSTYSFSAETLPVDEVWSLLVNELLLPIVEVIQQYETFQPTQEQLLNSFHHLREDMTAESIAWKVTIPLINFTSDVQQEEKLGTHLTLSPFTPEEKTKVWNVNTSLDTPPMMPPHITFVDFRRTSFKLTGSYMQPQQTYGNEEIMSVLGDMLTALRLMNAGDVGAPALFHASQARFSWPSASFTEGGQLLRQSGVVYTLAHSDLPVLRTLHDALHRLSAHRSGLTVALRRFNQAYGRALLEDRIIDLTIALESCLLTEKEELNYRLSLRGAALLAQEKSWSPSDAQSLLRAMYAIRSAIVHSGQQLADLGKDAKKVLRNLGLEPYEFSQQCENIVRAILKAFVMRLDRNQSLERVIQQLDRCIVQSLATLSDKDMPTSP